MSTGDVRLEQLATYGASGGDPRGRVVSVAWLAMLPGDVGPPARPSAEHARSNAEAPRLMATIRHVRSSGPSSSLDWGHYSAGAGSWPGRSESRLGTGSRLRRP